MPEPITAVVVFSSNCARCQRLHTLLDRVKPEYDGKVRWEDHDISLPAERRDMETKYGAGAVNRIPFIAIGGAGPLDGVWWLGVPDEDDLKKGLSGLWVKANASNGHAKPANGNGALARVPHPVAIAMAAQPESAFPAGMPLGMAAAPKGHEHWGVLDQPMSEGIRNLLRFNIEGMISDLLAIETHLSQIDKSAIADSWCIQKHRMHGRNHMLLEAINHASEVSPELSEKFKSFLPEWDEWTAKPDIACIRKLRNWIREEVGDKTFGKGCVLCASDTAGAEQPLPPLSAEEEKAREIVHSYWKRQPWHRNGNGAAEPIDPVPQTWMDLVEAQFAKQGRFLTPPEPTADSKTIVPSREGEDLKNLFRNRDAHIRIEEGEIVADVFDSAVESASEAHIESENAPHTDEGAWEVTHFLRTFGFDVVVKPLSAPRKRKKDAANGVAPGTMRLKVGNVEVRLRPYQVRFVPHAKIARHIASYNVTTQDGKVIVSPGGKELRIPPNQIWMSEDFRPWTDYLMFHELAEIAFANAGHSHDDAHRLAEDEERERYGDDPKWLEMVKKMGKLHLLPAAPA